MRNRAAMIRIVQRTMNSAATTAIAKNTYRTLHIFGSLLKSAQGTAPTSPECDSDKATSPPSNERHTGYVGYSRNDTAHDTAIDMTCF
jgi:hypothetical protein